MLTHEHFLRAIAAESHEPGHRLVYADWLEDQGDERAELIRVMEEMRTLPAYSDRFWELRPRRAALQEGAADKWLTELGYNVYRPLFGQLPKDRQHRWRLMIEFIETWHGPMGNSAGNTDAEINAAEERLLTIDLPSAVREWFALLGRHGPLTGAHNLHTIGNHGFFLHSVSDNLFGQRFYAEWEVTFDGDDPPVVRSDEDIIESLQLDDDEPWQEYESFSEFALQACLLEAVLTSPLRIDSRIGPRADRAFAPKWQCASISPLVIDATTSLTVWEAADLLCYRNEEGLLLMAGRNSKALRIFNRDTLNAIGAEHLSW